MLTIMTGRKLTKEWLTGTKKQVSGVVRSKEAVVDTHKRQARQKPFIRWRSLKGGMVVFLSLKC